MSLNWRVDKEDVVHLPNGILYNGKNDILKFVSKSMDLENIILTEVTQIQKNKYNMYSLTSGIKR